MNIYSPILFKFDTLIPSWTNTYKPYWVYIRTYRPSGGGGYHTDDRLIYGGKTFCSYLDASNATTTIDVAPLLTDFMWGLKLEYESDTQTYKPYAYRNLEVGRVLVNTPLEMDDDYLSLLNAYVCVEVGNPGGGYLIEKAVKTLLPSRWRKSYNIANPYAENSSEVNYNVLDTGILPEVPYVMTNEFWLGATVGVPLEYASDRNQSWFGNILHTGNSLDCYNLNVSGNFFLCPSLKYLYASTEGNIEEGSVISYYVQPNNKKALVYDVARVSECNADYYVSWITPYRGWQSQPFWKKRKGSKSERKVEVTSTQITNIDQVRKVVRQDNEYTLTLYSGLRRWEMVNLLQTVASAKDIYVYDVARDEGRWCLLEERTYTNDEASGLGEVTLTLRDNQIYRR